jgi:hypothetical protein
MGIGNQGNAHFLLLCTAVSGRGKVFNSEFRPGYVKVQKAHGRRCMDEKASKKKRNK